MGYLTKWALFDFNISSKRVGNLVKISKERLYLLSEL